jgi:hypothetical protein
VPFIIATASAPVDETQADAAAPTNEDTATDPEKPVAEETVVAPPEAEKAAKPGHARVDSAIDGMVPDATEGESGGKDAVADKLSTVTEATPVAEVGSEAV